MLGSIYSNAYHTFELPGTKIYFHRETHHGLVEISEGKGNIRRARLELSKETLSVQVPKGHHFPALDTGEVDTKVRDIILRRRRDGGWGLSIKGGVDGSIRVPILISKIFHDRPLEQDGELFVGDELLEVDGVNVENCTHEEVVQMLKDAQEQVCLKVRHNRSMAPFLRGSISREGSFSERTSEQSYKQSGLGSLKSDRDMDSSAASMDTAPRGWETLVKIPLPMAYVTRYLWSTDKLRPNGFEVRAMDGTSSGVIHCEDVRILEEWVGYILANITALNHRTIKMSNKYLHPNDLIVFIGWTCERIESGPEYWQNWAPKFVVLKGSDVCLFDTPPLSSTDMSRAVHSYKVYETAFQIIKAENRLDERKHVFTVTTAIGNKHYMSMESAEDLDQIAGAWQRATFYAVQRIGSKSFACNYESRPSALILDFNTGFAMYDIHAKRYLWRFRFSHLRSSSDDGKLRLQLIFGKPQHQQVSLRFKKNAPPTDVVVKDIYIDGLQLYSLVYSIHAFMVAKLVSVDPEYLQAKESDA